MPVLTLARWKTLRGYTGTAFDTTVAAWIPLVQARMERYIGCKLDEATYTDEPIDGTGTNVLLTRHWPIKTFTALKEITDDTTQTIAASTYRVVTGADSLGRITRDGYGSALTSTDQGLSAGVRRLGSFAVGDGNYLATYTAGYAVDGIPFPADMEEAAMTLLDSTMLGRGHSLDRISQASGTENTTFRTAEDTIKRMEAILQPFCRSVR